MTRLFVLVLAFSWASALPVAAQTSVGDELASIDPPASLAAESAAVNDLSRIARTLYGFGGGAMAVGAVAGVLVGLLGRPGGLTIGYGGGLGCGLSSSCPPPAPPDYTGYHIGLTAIGIVGGLGLVLVACGMGIDTASGARRGRLGVNGRSLSLAPSFDARTDGATVGLTGTF